MDAKEELAVDVDALIAAVRSEDFDGFELLWGGMSPGWRKAATFRMARLLAKEEAPR